MIHGSCQSTTRTKFRSGDSGISEEGSRRGHSWRAQKAGVLSETGDCSQKQTDGEVAPE